MLSFFLLNFLLTGNLPVQSHPSLCTLVIVPVQCHTIVVSFPSLLLAITAENNFGRELGDVSRSQQFARLADDGRTPAWIRKGEGWLKLLLLSFGASKTFLSIHSIFRKSRYAHDTYPCSFSSVCNRRKSGDRFASGCSRSTTHPISPPRKEPEPREPQNGTERKHTNSNLKPRCVSSERSSTRVNVAAITRPAWFDWEAQWLESETATCRLGFPNGPLQPRVNAKGKSAIRTEKDRIAGSVWTKKKSDSVRSVGAFERNFPSRLESGAWNFESAWKNFREDLQRKGMLRWNKGNGFFFV